MFETVLEWLLRSFGAFWIVGSGIAFHKAREAALMDQVLGALTGTPEDPLVTRFMFAGSLLTLFSGMSLVLATAWALLPLVLLVVSQLIYFGLMRHKRTRAQTEEEREDAQVQPSTRNAFRLSLLVLCATSAAVWLERFHW